MGYFWDYIEKTWQPIDHDQAWTRRRANRVNRRAELIEDLIREINVGRNSFTSLYANLLARVLVQTDRKLMDAYGKEVAEISEEEREREPRHQE